MDFRDNADMISSGAMKQKSAFNLLKRVFVTALILSAALPSHADDVVGASLRSVLSKWSGVPPEKIDAESTLLQLWSAKHASEFKTDGSKRLVKDLNENPVLIGRYRGPLTDGRLLSSLSSEGTYEVTNLVFPSQVASVHYWPVQTVGQVLAFIAAGKP